MKTAVLVTPLAKTFPIIPGAFYIGIDAGFLLLQQQGIEPDLTVGDFDSLADEQLALLAQLPKLKRHPVAKDETDTELALGFVRDYDRIYLAGGLGGRLDHTLANLSLMIHQYEQLICLDEHQQAQVFGPGVHEIAPVFHHVSFFALEPSQVSLQGFLYELNEALLTPQDIFTVSNGFKDHSKAVLTIEKGRLLCVQSDYR